MSPALRKSRVFLDPSVGHTPSLFYDTPRIVSRYMKEITPFDLLKPEDERALIKSAKKGDLEAQNRLIECNLKLVVSIAKNYRNMGLPFLDLIQEGTLGIYRTIEKFDLNLGLEFKFGSYARWWIRQGILSALAEDGRTVRLPARKVSSINRLRKVERNLTMELGRPPSMEEQAESVNRELMIRLARKLKREPTEEEIRKDDHYLDVQRIEKLIIESQAAYSVHAPVPGAEDENLNLQDCIVDDNTPDSPEALALNSISSENFFKILSSLNEREKEVIRMRFGLDGNKPKTLEEVGLVFQVTKERIRQIEEKALLKLRNAAIIKDYKKMGDTGY